MLFVTHDQVEALSLSDRIAVMHGGRVEQVGSPRCLYEEPASAFVRDFLGQTVVTSDSAGHASIVVVLPVSVPDKELVTATATDAAGNTSQFSLAVSEATLRLMATFGPNRFAPRAAVTRFAKALMDDPLLDAFGYRRPVRWERRLAAGALRLRGRIVRRMPPRAEPLFARQLPNIRSYPRGYKVTELGTFPPQRTPTPPAPRPPAPPRLAPLLLAPLLLAER